MRLAAFAAMVFGLLVSWLSLGVLKWVDLPFNRRPFIRWQDLRVPLEGAKDVTSEFTRVFIGVGIIFLVAALSALAPAVFARAKVPRLLLAVVYVIVLVASVVSVVIIQSDSSNSSLPAGEAQLLVVGIVGFGLLFGAIPAALLFFDKAWVLGGLIALIAMAGAVTLGFSLYDLFAEAVTGPKSAATQRLSV